MDGRSSWNFSLATMFKKHQTAANILRRKEIVYERIGEHKGLRVLLSELIFTLFFGLYIYGIIVGTFQGWNPLHFGVVALKMLILAFGTTALCTPTLYVFSALRGSNITLKQFLLLLVGMLATSALVLLGFVPIVWFFIFTADNSPLFIEGLHIVVMVLAVLFGFWFLQNGMRFFYEKYKADDKTTHSALDVLLIWFIVFAAVAIQMYSELSPWLQVDTAFLR